MTFNNFLMKDKVVFWCGFDFTQFCMAYYFQKKYDCELYSIVDITNNTKPFFENQKLVNFKKIWFLHDQYENNNSQPDVTYLKSFEQKYGIDIWKLALNERIFYGFHNIHKFSADEILSIVEQICKFYEKFFAEIKPDFFITKLTAFHHLEIFRQMCLYHGIKVLMLSSPKIPKKNMISQNDTKFDYIDTLLDVKCAPKTFSELQNDLKSLNESGSTLKQGQNYWKHHASNSKLKMFQIFFHYLFTSDQNYKTHYNYYGRTKLRVILNSINLSIRVRIREFFINKNFSKNPDLNTPFVYFPLGIVLERHILIGAPFFTNQVELVRHIVKSLPVGYNLLVKEHPIQKSREWRPISEYNEIIKIPNVTLIHPSYSDLELQKKCSLVISTAGGTPFEAAFHAKPSIIFGDALYLYLPFIKKIQSIELLPKEIRNSLNSNVDSLELTKYMKVLSENLINFSFADFFTEFVKRFAFSGGYNDVKIDEFDLENFIIERKESLEYLAMCHVEKIKEHKLNL